MDIHLIPGLGTDHRIFDRFLMDAPDRYAHDWPIMPDGSSLRDFAKKLASEVDITRPHILIGLSMGGMVVQEMAAFTKPVAVAIISSWKGPNEMPIHIRTLRGTHPERVLTKAMLLRLLPVIRWQMGVEGTDAAELLESFALASNLDRLKIQVAAVLDWEGPSQPLPNLVHIHGDNDRLMPLGSITGAHVVKGGSHFMVYQKSAEVERIIRETMPGL